MPQKRLSILLKYSKWTVLREVNPHSKRYGNKKLSLRQLEVQCECGVIKTLRLQDLHNKKSRSCVDCAPHSNPPPVLSGNQNGRWNGTKNVPARLFGRWKNNATTRGILFDIKINDIERLYKKQKGRCPYTGIDLILSSNPVGMSCRKGLSYAASLDRVDSKKGYTANNIELISASVNLMKSALPKNTFLQIIKLIALNNKALFSK